MNTWNTELQRRFSAANGIEAALYAVAISLEHISDQIEYQTECLGTGEGMTTMLRERPRYDGTHDGEDG